MAVAVHNAKAKVAINREGELLAISESTTRKEPKVARIAPISQEKG
jgi:hypothetical protein